MTESKGSKIPALFWVGGGRGAPVFHVFDVFHNRKLIKKSCSFKYTDEQIGM